MTTRSPSDGFDRKRVRQRLLPYYEELYKAYPVHQDFGGGLNALIDLVEENPDLDLEMILERAKSYAQNIDPDNIQFVPHLKSWLRDRRWIDTDLFTDQRVAERAWLRGCYRRADAEAVSERYGFIYTHPPVPDGVEDLASWHREQRRAWIAQVANHVLNGGPLPE